MHETYTALAIARHNAWVLLSRLIAPAESASQLILLVCLTTFGLFLASCHLFILESDARLSLFEFLLIQLLRCLPHVLALEVLDPKLDAA